MAARPQIRSNSYSRSASPPRLGGRRLLLVDSDPSRLALSRHWLEWQGGCEPETASLGDEALDILGAASQRFDAVAVWLPLSDEETTDLFGVLRRCGSPVRMVAVTASTPAEIARAGRLAGVAAVEDSGRPAALIAMLETVVASPQTVGAIVAARRVPPTISAAWALAVYGAPPGSRLHAALD